MKLQNAVAGALASAVVLMAAITASIGAAKASTVTFDVEGTLSGGGSFSGAMTLDETTPLNSTVAITDFPAHSFFDVFAEINIPGGIGDIKVKDAAGEILELDINSSSPLNGFLGGPITGGSLKDSQNNIEASVTGGDIATPLPSAFPLFATGLGGLGLLGWRRKRKTS